MKILISFCLLAFSYVIFSQIKDMGATKNPIISNLAPSNRIQTVKRDLSKEIARTHPTGEIDKEYAFFKYLFVEEEKKDRKKRRQLDLKKVLQKDITYIPWEITTTRSVPLKNINQPNNEPLSKKITINLSASAYKRYEILSSIEFLWPNDLRERQNIFHILSKCFDVMSGVITSDNKIYLMDAAPGDNHLITSFQSRHVRVKNYNKLRSEKTRIENIKKYHGLSEGILVRIFPKKLDDFIFQHVFNSSNFPIGLKKEKWQYRLIGKSNIYLVNISSNGPIDRFQLPDVRRECSP